MAVKRASESGLGTVGGGRGQELKYSEGFKVYGRPGVKYCREQPWAYVYDFYHLFYDQTIILQMTTTAKLLFSGLV